MTDSQPARGLKVCPFCEYVSMEVVTAELVGDERVRNDSLAYAMVAAQMPKDDAIRMLLAERERLMGWVVDVEKTRPRLYPIAACPVTDAMIDAAMNSHQLLDNGREEHETYYEYKRKLMRAALVAALQAKP